jgi:hypothetical protein
MLYVREVAVWIEINTKQINTVWVEYQCLILKLLVPANSRL